ncbi:f0b5f32a-e12d-4ed5-8bb4-9ad5818aaaf7 [Thermothielavioides terrestris]|nr:f0b5f32a-e12d-4ed5-8bb4-9ad5818aaaf7 [Thermothielavioides terrestris]
MSFYPKR